MSSDPQARPQINKLYASIRLFRSRRIKEIKRKNQLARANDQLEDLIRQKVVRQLHDGLSQTVSALAMRVNFARRLMDEDPIAAKNELEKVEHLARDTTREIRNLIFLLRQIPPDSQNLVDMLGLLVEKMEELFDLKIEFEVDSSLVDRLPMRDQMIIYYLVEDAIGNARKRNGSKHLSVHLNQYERQIAQLVIEDSADTLNEKGIPFQAAEMDNLQEFSQLINASVRVLDEGAKIQILFPISL